jgi:calmodulin
MANIDLLSEEIIKECKEVFELFDSDNDNYLTINEFKEAMKAMGINSSESELEIYIKKYSDSNKKINPIIFRTIYCEYINSHQPSEEDLIELFKLFDSDNDGIITNIEMKYAMKNFGDNIKDEEIDDLVKEIDINKDGKIRFNEFVNLIIKKGYR